MDPHKRNMCEAIVIQDFVLRAICSVLELYPSSVDQTLSFPSLGGDSLAAVSLSSACKRHGISLSVEAVLLHESISKLVECATRMSSKSLGFDGPLSVLSSPSHKLKRKHQNNIELHTAARPEAVLAPHVAPPVPPYSSLEGTIGHSLMTEMQLVLFHGSQINLGTNIISFYETYLSKDLSRMKEAWKTVIESEDIFRSNFEIGEGRITTNTTVPFHWTENYTSDEDAYQLALEEKPIHSSVGTLFDVVTIDRGLRGPNISTIIWRVHHALIDGYSASLVYVKVRQAAEGHPVQPGTPFAEVASSLRRLQESSFNARKNFWKQQNLEFPSAVGELVFPPPLIPRPEDGHCSGNIPLQVPVDQLTACAQSLGVTPAAVYYSAWALVISKYTDSDSVLFGIVLSGRNLPLEGVQDTIGPLINTLPFFTSVKGATSAAQYLRDTFRRIVELGSMQFSVPEDGYSRHFSSAVAMEFEMLFAEGSEVLPIADNYTKTTSEIPLSVFFGAGGKIRLCYDPKRYNGTDVELLAEHYRNAILALLIPEHTLAICMETMLPHGCRKNLLEMGNCDSSMTSPSSVSDDLVTMFERTAIAHPEVVAVERGDQKLTYRDLDIMANQVSQYLGEHIQPDDVVCVHADRSVHWIIAIYGILKAGGVYASLDPALSSCLRDSNFQAAGAPLFLTPGRSEKSLTPRSCNMCISIDEILDEIHPSASTLHRRHPPRPHAPAYMCFTSGSSGKPKPVLCSHDGLVAFQRDKEVRLFAEPGCRISQIMSPAFDGSIHEIFSALTHGATLVLAHSAHPFAHLESVTSAILTPSIAKVLVPGDYPKLQNVYLVGEPVPQYVNDIWAAEKKLYNMYGPTEATCGATIKRLHTGLPVNIGHPNSSSRIYILDRHQRLVPPGVIGEIYIAGVQVARGYVRRPEETAKHFLPDLVCPHPGERMYRTGDRGYWSWSGEIDCLGRLDRQTKLHGFRLDLNDIEFRIGQAVKESTAVAVARTDDYLVAMIQPASLGAASLKPVLARRLPPHALPRYMVATDNFPMTSAGKVDYQAIAASVTSELETTATPLETHTEKTIADAWRDILKLQSDVRISADSNFVSLGGHSIVQLQLASRLTGRFKRQIPLSLVIESPTLQGMASSIDEHLSLPQDSSSPKTMAGTILQKYSISPMEQEWWDKYRLGVGCSAFNVALACVFDASLVDRKKLRSAWDTVTARHSILSSRFVGEGKQLWRQYSDHRPRAHRVKRINFRKEVNRPFRIDVDNPIRVLISKSQMLVCISHIICDLTMLRVLLREVASVYNGACLPPVKRTYVETSHWGNVASPCNLDFWSKYLKALPKLQLGNGKFPGRRWYGGSSHVCKLPRGLLQRLQRLTDSRGFTFHQVALAAVSLALQTDSDSMDIVLGSPYINRGDEDLETVGLFLEPLPIRIRYKPSTSASPSSALVQSVQQSSQSALTHTVPWTQLLRHLQITPDFPNHPLFDTMVTFHDDRHTALVPLQHFEPLLTWADGAKFKLMCEFSTTASECSLLRIEYDTDSFSQADILRLERLISEALECLVTDLLYGETKRRLREVTQMKKFSALDEVRFGSTLSTL